MSSHFGSGSVFGNTARDDIYLQSSDDPSKVLHVKNFYFGVIEKDKGVLDSFNIDAIIGLAYKGLIQGKEKEEMIPLFDAIVQSKQLD